MVRFAETLDRSVPFKTNIKGVMGGSLGGNMTFLLGLSAQRSMASRVRGVVASINLGLARTGCRCRAASSAAQGLV